jgi:hypothetical protein
MLKKMITKKQHIRIIIDIDLQSSIKQTAESINIANGMII